MHTTVCVLTDKEEIGSDGVTGMQSMYVFHFLQLLCRAAGQDDIIAFQNSVCLSADVTAAYDPSWAGAFEPQNGTYAGRGVAFFKYTGSRGKSSASDANAELVGDITRLLDANDVAWQIGELGRLDLGGGGTIAKYVANRGIPVLDIGVPVLSMHSPFEVIHKTDLYMAYRTFSLFCQTLSSKFCASKISAALPVCKTSGICGIFFCEKSLTFNVSLRCNVRAEVKQMNIKQASKQSGVSAPNIRFYEKEGLLTPARQPATTTAITPTGMSAPSGSSGCCGCWMCRLPTITAVLRGEQPLQQALQAQQTVLEQQAAHLAAACSFVPTLPGSSRQRRSLDVDACLSRMEHPAHAAGRSFRLAAGLLHAGTGAAPEAFFLYPGGQHQHPAGVHSGPADLRRGARNAVRPDQGGMYPEFSLDGISYKAYRNPGKYRDEICCDAVHPEQLDTGLPSRRETAAAHLRVLAACRCAPLPPSWRQGG